MSDTSLLNEILSDAKVAELDGLELDELKTAEAKSSIGYSITVHC